MMRSDPRVGPDASVGMLRTRLRLAPHDPAWTAFYDEHAGRIRRALDGVASRVEHIGSTSVPDLLAKPIVDVLVVVPHVGAFERCVEPLAGLGWTHRGQHGDDPLRRYWVLDRGGRRMAQLHVYAEAATAWRDAIAFRDLLREREALRRAYEREKLRIAEAVGWEKGAYSVGKGGFIESVLKGDA